jgi:hypothetical protein
MGSSYIVSILECAFALAACAAAADNVFLYSVASAVDIFVIWTLVLTAMGFMCVSKIKTGTAYAVVFGWWMVFTLAGAAIGAAFS